MVEQFLYPIQRMSECFFFQQPLHRKPPKRTQTWATKSEIENRFHLPRQDFNHYTAKPFVPCPPASMIADDRRKSLIIVFVLLFKRRYQCVVLRCCLLGRWLTNCLPRRFGPQATRTDRAYQLASIVWRPQSEAPYNTCGKGFLVRQDRRPLLQ